MTKNTLNSTEQLKTREAILDGYLTCCKLDSLKDVYRELKTEKKRLNRLDPITKSGANKRLALPILNAKLNDIRAEYNALFVLVEDWLNLIFPSEYDNDKYEILTEYYRKIDGNDLQQVIDEFLPPRISGEGEAEKIITAYTASNLRQCIEIRWHKEFEGR